MLTSGTDTYDLDTKFTDYGGAVHEVVWGTVTDPGTDTSEKLQYVEPDRIYDYQYNTSGLLGYYTIVGTKIIFAGVPAAADSGVSIRVRYTCTDGTYTAAGSEETTLGKRYPHLLVNKVSYELAMSEQDAEISSAADRYGKAYERGFDQALQTLSRQSTEPRFMQTSETGLL